MHVSSVFPVFITSDFTQKATRKGYASETPSSKFTIGNGYAKLTIGNGYAKLTSGSGDGGRGFCPTTRASLELFSNWLKRFE